MAAMLFLVSDQTCKEIEAMQTHRIVAQLLNGCPQLMHAKLLQALCDVCCSTNGGSVKGNLIFPIYGNSNFPTRVGCVFVV